MCENIERKRRIKMKEKVRSDYSTCACAVRPLFEKVVSYKIRCIGFITEVVRGFLYPKNCVRTSSDCIKFGTLSVMLWCDERKKKEKLKVRNMYVCGMSIYFSKGRQKTSRLDAGLLNRKDLRCILYVITFSTGKEIWAVEVV